MGDLVVVAEECVAGPPESVFGRFGSASGAGWLFDASCDTVLPGAVARFAMQAPGGGPSIQCTGRIVEVDPGRRLVLQQESPWRGRVALAFSPDGTGARVRLRADLAEATVVLVVAASLTFLPALLGLVGERICGPRIRTAATIRQATHPAAARWVGLLVRRRYLVKIRRRSHRSDAGRARTAHAPRSAVRGRL